MLTVAICNHELDTGQHLVTLDVASVLTFCLQQQRKPKNSSATKATTVLVATYSYHQPYPLNMALQLFYKRFVDYAAASYKKALAVELNKIGTS
jgi:hypothetical protein